MNIDLKMQQNLGRDYISVITSFEETNLDKFTSVISKKNGFGKNKLFY